MKRFLGAWLLVLIATSLLNFLAHGILLQPDYQRSANLLRSAQDGSAHAPFLLLSGIVLSFAFVWIYTKGIGDKPWLQQGLRYGLVVWLMVSVARYGVDYAVAPWPGEVVLKEIGLELPIMQIMGAIVAAIYKREKQSAS